jgi:hypothetical protein
VKQTWLICFLILSFSLMVCQAVEKLINRDPLIKSVTANPYEISVNDTTNLKVEAEDPDNDILTYRWDSNSVGQFITNTTDTVRWIAPSYPGRFQIKIKVTDENGGKANGDVFVNVRDDANPIVTITQPLENEIISGLGKHTIKVDVSFIWQIKRVDFFIDGDSVHSDFSSPYEWTEWDVTSLSGRKTILAKAYDEKNISNFGVDSVHVTIEGIVPIPKRNL